MEGWRAGLLEGTPVLHLECCDRADDAGCSGQRTGDDLCRVHGRPECSASDFGAERHEQRVAGLRDATGDHHDVRIQNIQKIGDPGAQVARGIADDLARRAPGPFLVGGGPIGRLEGGHRLVRRDGRAGRTAPGRCVRLWTAQEHGERLHAVVVPNFDYLKSKKIANAREALRDQIAGLSNQLPKYKRLMSYQVQGDPLPRTTTRKIKRMEIKGLVESGELKASDTTPAASPSDSQNTGLESAVGQEVISCLRETYHRDVPIDPNMNLELDLGFDSMERIELLTSLEEVLHVALPEDFGAEILTVRDLITGLERQAGILTTAGTASRQSWKTILARDSDDAEKCLPFHLPGAAVTISKYICLRLIYYLVFRTLLRLTTQGFVFPQAQRVASLD